MCIVLKTTTVSISVYNVAVECKPVKLLFRDTVKHNVCNNMLSLQSCNMFVFAIAQPAMLAILLANHD